MTKANSLFREGDARNANKYFSKVMLFSEPETPEYKLAKSRVANV